MRHQGKGRGQNRRRATKRRITGFLQPIFLLQLYNQDRHGYDAYSTESGHSVQTKPDSQSTGKRTPSPMISDTSVGA